MRMAREKHRNGFHHVAAEIGHALVCLGRRGYGFKFVCSCGTAGLYRERRNIAWANWVDHVLTETQGISPPLRSPSPRKLPAGFLRAR